MRIGIFAGDGSLDDLLALARTVESEGFDSLWLPQIFGVDALCAHTLIGHSVPRIELGTAVVPTYPRHPAALAGQALTASAASGGRLTLGIGLSHQLVIEGMFGYSFDKPVRHMREYLSALVPLLSGEAADFEGETLTAKVGLSVPGASTVPVLVAALGPKMLQLAAERTAGTVTWMTGPRTLAEHTVPTITAAAEAAGTGDMRVVGALPVAVTDDADAVKAKAAKVFQVYGILPSYRAMLDREGAAGPEDVALIGTASQVRAGIGRMRDAGVTDFVAVEFNADEPVATATRDLLREFT
ncbi:MAG TPA: TIGR03564 family F420-dependent LLM class oxidoreductase [Aquihabitans sp.]|jgi:F420-dependent oxidoreductase-like protein|nr:TIGR03564 family F420-dependent LLM class oxidoreductase [Aquihabitans sp.]